MTRTAKDAYDTMGFEAGQKVRIVGYNKVYEVIAVRGTHAILDDDEAHVTKLRLV